MHSLHLSQDGRLKIASMYSRGRNYENLPVFALLESRMSRRAAHTGSPSTGCYIRLPPHPTQRTSVRSRWALQDCNPDKGSSSTASIPRHHHRVEQGLRYLQMAQSRLRRRDENGCYQRSNLLSAAEQPHFPIQLPWGV